ncbi:hypothetical protein A2480_04005 [Candidatus Uhrbacteria bacterium RIFOXYC2_FULL_47_19]|uniref:AtpZ/AtpI family protein n=1 Tax=Candidatus Uhrbacteria bacterium RIFOXYC2_FULL_47_19 TaxID=1802424 RepID=A0A1F7WDU9_9BACT|nr:MAG: hypothetical protein A2480_04005 [Candidatus Uhrbacteria bacterium RIFOXYC2_FULL_47_19]HCC22550.1 hypothetical protein [Candidatus Uhrbacteria bacterium]
MTVDRSWPKIVAPFRYYGWRFSFSEAALMSTSDQDRKYIQLGLRIVGEFGAIIAVPIVLLTLLGRYVDARYETSPIFLIAGFVLAAVLSSVSIYRRAKQFGHEYQTIEHVQKNVLKNSASTPQTRTRDEESDH